MGGSRQTDDNRIVCPALFAFVLLLCAPALEAQPFSYLTGLIRDPSDAAVPGASVSVLNEDTGFRRWCTSSGDGAYSVAGLQPGSYRITVRKEGFRTMIRVGTRVLPSQPARIDFELALGSMQETVTVRDDAPTATSSSLPSDTALSSASMSS